MMKLILAVLFMTMTASASEISEAFAKKDYVRITEIYRAAPKKNHPKKDLVYISYSLRKRGFYRQDIKLNIRLINQNYKREHKKLLKAVNKGDTIDGEEYPTGLKVLYWNLMNDFGQILESYKDASTLIKQDHQHYLVFSKMLSELEFRESKVDKYNDRIVAHIQYLENKVYRFSSSLSFQYISWQTESSLVSGSSKSGLVVTNRGLCAGGDIGMENAFYHFYVDGCFFMGSGGVSSDANSGTTYSQANVPAFGAKFGPGASMIVSSSGSRIGFRIPIIYTSQTLQKPSSPLFEIEAASPVSIVGSIYSRWQFDKWFFQTEFGKYVQVEQTFWGLGIGRKF
jgi:hypothetical protein